MQSLLANYLSVGDLIVVHMCGEKQSLSLVKSTDQLGLTVTDNGHGRAFVKKVKSCDQSIEQAIHPGDHIAVINNESVIGMRHYEVAQILRQIPLQSKFTLDIIRPIAPNEPTDRVTANPVYRSDNDGKHSFSLLSKEQTSRTNDIFSAELTDLSLPMDKLLSKTSTEGAKSTASTSNIASHNMYATMIKSINAILESFLGINDDTLAVQIYRLAKDSDHSYEHFSKALKESELNIFKFSQDIETHLWNCVNDEI